jgi:hypothetical protein
VMIVCVFACVSCGRRECALDVRVSNARQPTPNTPSVEEYETEA